MSYILDALKKSEQERGHGTAPSVQTLHATGSHYHASKTHWWPYVLLAAIAVNLAALLYFMLIDTDVSPSAHNPQDSVITAQNESEAALVPSTLQDGVPRLSEAAEEIVYKPVLMPASTPVIAQETGRPAEFAPTPVRVSAPKPAVTQRDALLVVPQRDELPADIQQHIPIMEFSAHVYSSNPLHRSIVINGRVMEEGDMFASDLLLSEITPKGAIFDYQGQLFHQNVVSAWN
jgi:general secretion pathway protein B